MDLTCRDCGYPGIMCICTIEERVEQKPLMSCGWCGCEMTDAEPFCDDCVEALNDSMELQLNGVTSDTEEREVPEAKDLEILQGRN